MHRRKIVLISGSGRTGSTLLSLLLSQHRDVFNLGQLRDLGDAWSKDAPCTCGNRLSACPVYGPIGRSMDLAELGTVQTAFLADAARLPDWSDTAAVARLGEAHADYLERLGRLLDLIQKATGAETFVDASKSPEIALALSLTEGTDARVLNLARDPRAVAVSWRQRRSRISAAWKFARVWAERQRLLGAWAGLLGGRFRLVRYEDFAARPKETVEAIQAWAGLPATPGLFDRPDHALIGWEGQHLYPPANERVLAERAAEATIRPSDGWRDKRHGLTHWLAMWGSGAEGRRYVDGAP